jgi:hypothetical protein
MYKKLSTFNACNLSLEISLYHKPWTTMVTAVNLSIAIGGSFFLLLFFLFFSSLNIFFFYGKTLRLRPTILTSFNNSIL